MTVRHLAETAALVAFAIALPLGVIELGLRVLLPPQPGDDLSGLHVIRRDKPWLYGLRPGAVTHAPRPFEVRYEVNADGFRDRRYARPKPPGTFRILVLGDSVTFGYGVAEQSTYVKRLETLLSERATGPPIEVLNLGVSGYNPYTEAALLADVGPTYQPDLVLVQFCVNDLNDPTLHFDAATRRALTLPPGAFPNPADRAAAHGRLGELCRRSYLCRLVAEVVAPTPVDAGGLSALAPHVDPRAEELAWLAARYAAMAREAAAMGARFAVVVFPFRGQERARDPGPLQVSLRHLGEEAGWDVIDLLPAFRAGRGDAPLFQQVWHPSTAGHRVAAEALARQLACRGLAPAGCEVE